MLDLTEDSPDMVDAGKVDFSFKFVSENEEFEFVVVIMVPDKPLNFDMTDAVVTLVIDLLVFEREVGQLNRGADPEVFGC